jgi:hypothetical protein
VVPDKTDTSVSQEVHEEAVVLQVAQLAEQAVQSPELFIKNPVSQRHCPDEFGEPALQERHRVTAGPEQVLQDTSQASHVLSVFM